MGLECVGGSLGIGVIPHFVKAHDFSPKAHPGYPQMEDRGSEPDRNGSEVTRLDSNLTAALLTLTGVHLIFLNRDLFQFAPDRFAVSTHECEEGT